PTYDRSLSDLPPDRGDRWDTWDTGQGAVVVRAGFVRRSARNGDEQNAIGCSPRSPCAHSTAAEAFAELDRILDRLRQYEIPTCSIELVFVDERRRRVTSSLQ